jgi:hypothetical protein
MGEVLANYRREVRTHGGWWWMLLPDYGGNQIILHRQTLTRHFGVSMAGQCNFGIEMLEPENHLLLIQIESLV